MALKLFLALSILLIVIQGHGAAACGLQDIAVSQAPTGSIVEGQREYRVVITNNCDCAQSQVVVRCYGLNSVEPVDENTIRILNNQDCLLRNGGFITRATPVFFRYAWKTPQDFPLVSSKLQC